MTETPENRLKRLKLRSIRRGIREMDLLLGAFAAETLASLGAQDLDAYEALLEESDHDLLAWVTGAADVPPEHARLIARIGSEAREIGRPERYERL